LSITTGCPSAFDISVATSRATVSEVPAAKGTITRIAWLGQGRVCARAGSATSENRAATAARRAIWRMAVPPSPGRSGRGFVAACASSTEI
jgi:hypothetical protein